MVDIYIATKKWWVITLPLCGLVYTTIHLHFCEYLLKIPPILLLRTENVCQQISKQIFMPNRGYDLFTTLTTCEDFKEEYNILKTVFKPSLASTSSLVLNHDKIHISKYLSIILITSINLFISFSSRSSTALNFSSSCLRFTTRSRSNFNLQIITEILKYHYFRGLLLYRGW